MAKYRIHWYHEDMGSWVVEPADSTEARDFMEADALVELDPVLVRRVEDMRLEFLRMCDEIRQERDRQAAFDPDQRRWVPKEDAK